MNRRYIDLALLIIAGGALYPIMYLRQNFESDMLFVFNLSDIQLGELYSILGFSLFLGYAPGGWLADTDC